MGSYCGLRCGMILHPLGEMEVNRDGTDRSREQLKRDDPGPVPS